MKICYSGGADVLGPSSVIGARGTGGVGDVGDVGNGAATVGCAFGVI